MNVQLLRIEDCPNSTAAETRLRDALVAVGLDQVPVEVVVIRNESEAARSRFGGSPTFLIDGEDPFPATRTRSLACRVYATGEGFAGAPTQAQLEAALRERL